MVSNYRKNGPTRSRNRLANLRSAFANQQQCEKRRSGKSEKIKG